MGKPHGAKSGGGHGDGLRAAGGVQKKGAKRGPGTGVSGTCVHGVLPPPFGFQTLAAATFADSETRTCILFSSEKILRAEKGMLLPLVFAVPCGFHTMLHA